MSRLFGRARECAALDAAVARARGGEGGSRVGKAAQDGGSRVMAVASDRHAA